MIRSPAPIPGGLMVTMRAMGFEPSPAELQKMVVQAQLAVAPHVADPQAKMVTEEQFTEIMTMKMGETSTYEETCQAFRMFSPTVETPDEGVVLTKEDLHRITNMLGIEGDIEAETLAEGAAGAAGGAVAPEAMAEALDDVSLGSVSVLGSLSESEG